MCVTGQLQHTRHLVLHKVDPEPQLDSQEGKVHVFFFYFMYLLLIEYAFKISPVDLFVLSYVF